MKCSYNSCRNLILRLFLSVFIISETLQQIHFLGRGSHRGGKMCLRAIYSSSVCNRSSKSLPDKASKNQYEPLHCECFIVRLTLLASLGEYIVPEPLLFAIFSLKRLGSLLPPSSKTWTASLPSRCLALVESPGNPGWNKGNLVLGDRLHTANRRGEKRERLGLRKAITSNCVVSGRGKKCLKWKQWFLWARWVWCLLLQSFRHFH